MFYYKTYFSGTDQIQWKISYSTDYVSTPDKIAVYEYRANGRLRSKELASPEPDDTIYYQFINEDFYGDNSGRITQKRLSAPNADGELMFYYKTYFSGTDQIQWKISYSTDYVSTPDKVAAYEYNTNGDLVTKTLYYANDRIKSKLLSEADEDGAIFYHYFDEDWNGQGYGRLHKKVLSEPDENGAIAYEYIYQEGTDIIIDEIGYAAADLSDPANPVFTDPIPSHVWGANLPWGKYGYDIGLPASGGTHEGFSSAAGRPRLENLLSQRQNSTVRVWLFCDLRAGVNFNPDGSLSFKDQARVYADMDALLEVAEENNVKILPVLFDRTLSVEGDAATAQLGLHPEVITDSQKRAALISLFADHFMDRYINDPNIYAWDILNEPEVAPEVMDGVVTNEQQWDFIRLFAEMINGKLEGSTAGQLVTTGNKDRKYLTDMLTYWQGGGYNDVLSLYEFHYYNAMGKSDLAPLSYEERLLIGDTPVLIGELSSASEQRQLGSETWTEITEKQDYISQNGFAGGLFWHDDSLNNIDEDDLYLSAGEWLESTNWTSDINKTFYASGRRESKTFERPDFYGAVYYHYADNDALATNYGTIDTVIYGDPGYEGAIGLTYEYPVDPSIDYIVRAYQDADYSDPSNPVLIGNYTTYTYYANGSIGGIAYPYQENYTIAWDDGTYTSHISEVFDSSGKAYIFRDGNDYDWNNRYNWGNYIGYRNTWDANLELYSGLYPIELGGGPEYQSNYSHNESNNTYQHLATYYRSEPGWGGGQSVNPAVANHPQNLDSILLRPHIDPLSEVITELASIEGSNGIDEVLGDLIKIESLTESLETLQSGYTAEGITVAILDSGVYADILDLDIYYGYNFIDNNENYMDDVGHGTKVASIITDIAPDADIIAAKVFSSNGETTSDILSKAIINVVDMGAKVLAMPFSIFPISSQLEAAISYAAERGAILISAAGNNGSGVQDSSLAAQENVITVGSVNNDGELSSWSNYNSEIDLFAPWDVLSSGEAGTSFSAAFVAGMAALILSENPNMTKDEVLEGLKNLLKDFTPEDIPEENIKGARVDEVLSKQSVEAQNRADFTRYNLIDKAYNDPRGIN